MRVPPAWLSDTAEVWARTRGKHAKAVWNPEIPCWALELEHRHDHPAWSAWLNGESDTKPVEVILLVEPGDGSGLVPIDLNELGAQGLTGWLDAADVMTGRGKHPNLFAAMLDVRKSHQRLRDERRAAVDEAAREAAWLHARTLTGTPYLTVGKDLKE